MPAVDNQTGARGPAAQLEYHTAEANCNDKSQAARYRPLTTQSERTDGGRGGGGGGG